MVAVTVMEEAAPEEAVRAAVGLAGVCGHHKEAVRWGEGANGVGLESLTEN